MNLQEAKQLFNAQYLNQKVFLWDDRGPLMMSDKQLWERGESIRCSLLLRTVNQLTDGEQLVIAGLFDLDEKQIADTDLLEWIEAIFNETAGYYIDGYTGSQLLSAIDYMRSIGIILQITYLNEENQPVTLQPDEIVSLGWATVEE